MKLYNVTELPPDAREIELTSSSCIQDINVCANLRNIEFTTFIKCNFSAALTNTRMSQCVFDSCHFKHLTASRCNLSMFKNMHFMHTNLTRTYFHDCNFSGCDFAFSNLMGTVFMKCDLTDTVLDLRRKANGDVDGFKRDGYYVYGYRTEAAGHIGKYIVGRTYSADIFSTCSRTECHPGLYLWPTKRRAHDWSGLVPYIKVKALARDVHRVGNKWRCRAFTVVSSLDKERNSSNND